jgi:non-ribosomal peptide synthetase component F
MHATCRPHDVFARFAFHACARPDAPALLWKGQTTSYGELLDRCERLSEQLRQLGAGPDTVVGLRMERSGDLVAAMLAVLRAQAAYLPLDLSIPPERAAYMLESSRANILLTDPGRADELKADNLAVVEVKAELFAAASRLAITATTAVPDQLAYVLYTSGSTGKPKACRSAGGRSTTPSPVSSAFSRRARTTCFSP